MEQHYRCCNRQQVIKIRKMRMIILNIGVRLTLANIGLISFGIYCASGVDCR